MLYVPFLLQREVFTDHSPGTKDGRVSAKVTLDTYRHLHTYVHTVLCVCRGLVRNGGWFLFLLLLCCAGTSSNPTVCRSSFICMALKRQQECLQFPQNSKNSTTKILKCHRCAQPTPAASHATQKKGQSPSCILQNHM